MASQQFVSQQIAESDRPARISNRAMPAFVYGPYRARIGEHADESAVVTKNGKPITANGETLLLGMVPMERRYAIGPCQNGKAEVLPQHEFEVANQENYIAEYQMFKQAPDKVALRHIPNVAQYVAWKIDPTDPTRIAPLGFLPGAKPAEVQVTDTHEIEVLRAQKDEQALALDEMQRKLDELAELVTAKPAAAPVKAKASVETAPCGKEIKAGFVKQHARFCKKPECQPAE
jgi:hypothetical protein